jgi:hypothetical protein
VRGAARDRVIGSHSVERARPRQQAWRYDGHMQCPSCQRELRDSEPIHRVALSWFDRMVLLVCRDCAARMTRGDRKWLAPKACEGCGRSVIYDTNHLPTRVVICGEACRCALRAAAAPDREDPAERRCRICDRLFLTTRPNSLYCSPACRQKAYRQRVAVTPPTTTL